jgi:hypothetical protein
VHAIDPHTGNKEHLEALGTVDTYAGFLENIRTAGVADLVEPLRTTSCDARSRFADSSVNLLFVDGSHEYLDVLRDIEDWTPALADGAVIAFNDPLFPGVYRALRQVVLIGGSPYTNARYIANTLFFRFEQKERWSRSDALSLLWLRLLLALRYRLQGTATHLPFWAIRWVRWLYQRILP